MCFGVFPRTRQYVTVFSVTNNHDLLLIDIRLLVFDWFTISYSQIQVIPMKTRPQWSIKPHVLILINYICDLPTGDRNKDEISLNSWLCFSDYWDIRL